jgi:hypothetical protein
MAERARVAAEVEGLVQRRALIDELQARAKALAQDEDAWRVRNFMYLKFLTATTLYLQIV